MKKSVILLLALSLLLLPCHAVEKAEEDTFSLPCKAALLMERESGTVL